MDSIFGTRLLFVKVAGDGVTVRSLTVEDLRHENLGHPDFVRGILASVCNGRVYDDSDPAAYTDGGPFYYYLPGNRVEVDGVPMSALIRLLEVLKDSTHREAARRLRELAEEADTANPTRLREIDEERAEIETDLAEAFVELLKEVSDGRSDVS